jgi:restriction endonuclease S subunit
VAFCKTSAINRDFINLNDLHYIDQKFHKTKLSRSITKPYDVIYSMTGKFMGKASLCPNVVNEMNMSQNSVVIKNDNKLFSDQTCIFLNSKVNRIQMTGSYSITKQKYINQGRIAELKVPELFKNKTKFLENYINNLNIYYESIVQINELIDSFNHEILNCNFISDQSKIFIKKKRMISSKILTPKHHDTFNDTLINQMHKMKKNKTISDFKPRKGNEISSSNYVDEGIPFIKTSGFSNFGVDTQSNHYCTEEIYKSTKQEVNIGDIIFTKDGKIGEVGIIDETKKVVLSAGIVIISIKDLELRYWLFLLLNSAYGKIMFKKWNVIASTMSHLRKDLYQEFLIPEISKEIREKYINKIRLCFEEKLKAHQNINLNKSKVLDVIQ